MIDIQNVCATAPGKLVLSGEYVVLDGAPAIVLAVNRFARCQLEIQQTWNWDVRSIPAGVSASFSPETLPCYESLQHDDLLRWVSCLSSGASLPRGGRLTLDTRGFYRGHQKLGIGSSSALVVAITGALDCWRDTQTPISVMRHWHSALQEHRGSGLDVAAAAAGGVIRFTEGCASPVTLAPELEFRFVYTGQSTSTAAMLERFENARQGHRALERWRRAAAEVARHLDDSQSLVSSLIELTDVMLRFDKSRGTGIFGPAHLSVLDVASRAGIAYKPSGAGGGDMGIAISTDADALDQFGTDIVNLGLTIEDMKVAPRGLNVQVS